ncbi:MAG: phosphoribosyltransferase [Spirochaetes bacterium]|nr:phosphoribosyltransferase [Spirochaetota bacterium]
MFKDRTDAGQKLARALGTYRDSGALVLAIPRGGVPVGYEVAAHLHLDLSVIVARKLPYPFDPEAGFGAIAEDGSTFIFDNTDRLVGEPDIGRIIREQRREVMRRVRVLRGDGPIPAIEGRTIMLVDDGIAMGATMRAAILMCRHLLAKRVIVAAPVSGSDVAKAIARTVDETTILETPVNFHAVAQVYESWRDISDDEVVAILHTWKTDRAQGRS